MEPTNKNDTKETVNADDRMFSLLESDRDLGMPLFSTSFASISSRVSSTGVLYQAVVDFDEVNVTNVSTVEDNTLTGTS